MIINGKEIALKEYEKLREEIASLSKKPNLVDVLVGNNSSSLRYITQKKKWAQKIGIDFQLIQFEENIKQEEIITMLTKLNNDEKINGIIVQLPLPCHIDTNAVINNISPIKDVDGFTAVNMGKVVLGDESALAPCTPSGVVHICKNIGINLEGKNITVIGRSNIVGKPLVSMCINEGATVTCCNSKTKNLKSHTQNADIVVLATGKPGILTKDMIKKEAFVIDVGFTVIDEKIYGDACFQEISENGNPITPVPGGVGALTVVYLMKNTLKAFYLQNKVVGTI